MLAYKYRVANDLFRNSIGVAVRRVPRSRVGCVAGKYHSNGVGRDERTSETGHRLEFPNQTVLAGKCCS